MSRYKRTSSRQSWDEENMKKAILAVREKKMGWFLASKTFKVPATTLRRRAEKEEGWKKEYLGGYKITFNSDLEEELAELLLDLQNKFFDLTTVDVRKLAYQIAVAKCIPHRFSDANKMAGWDWLQGFRQRNPSITLRSLKSTTAAAAKAYNENQTEKYFKKLRQVAETYKFEPGHIWNLLQSGLSTIPSQNSKNFGVKEKNQMRILTSTERDQHLTTVCCTNTTGTFIPPALIFSRKNMEAELMDGAPTGSIGFAEENGWMTGDIFLKWLKHFVEFTKVKPDKNVFLLVDGHAGHKNYEAIVYAKESGVVLFSIPPHCTHLARSVDVDFHVSLNMHYNHELSNWIRNHPEETCTHFQVASLFREAYLKSATVKNAQNVFSTMNVFPFMVPDETVQTSSSDFNSPLPEEKIPSTSQSSNKEITLEDISLFLSLASQNEYLKCENVHRLQTTKIEAKRLKKSVQTDKDVSNTEEDIECIYCNDLFSCSRSMDVWLKCQTCNHWCHADCAGVDQRIKM